MTEPTVTTSWADVSDVIQITGVTVDDDQVVQAQAIVESVVHRVFGQNIMRIRDLAWLRKAVAYQAAWMTFQPDLFFRVSTSNTSGDGQSETMNTKADHYLAPLAGRAIKNISWMKSRSLRIRTPFLDGGTQTTPLDPSLADDSNLPWSPM